MKTNIRNKRIHSFVILCAVILMSVFPASAVLDKAAVGGMPFGVKLLADGIIVVGFADVETASGTETPAYDAGLRINDVITEVNGSPVKTSAELIDKIENAESSIEITFTRGGKESTAEFSPALSSSDGKKKSGMWIRDTPAGIGTVTFVDTDTGSFAGLGHGICDPATGEVIQMDRGTVVDVQISGVKKGVEGQPGELKGYFTSDKSGVLLGNTETGVYGVFSDIPDELIPDEEIEFADRSEVRCGDAYIWCTLDDGEPQKYSVKISNICPESKDNRSFTVTVTDKKLIEKTGGIVQGMSGSPIIQNGKLIGAVTHVLVNDPTSGYGIFIDSMIDMLPEIMK